MYAGEQGKQLLEGLPFWAQVAANAGIFVAALIVGAFGFLRKLHVGPDLHAEPVGVVHITDESIKGSTEALVRIAVVGESMLQIMRDHDRQADIDREVERRLKEYKASQV
jgi:hypothetical protein